MVGPALAIAYALNSVKFDPATAGRCNDSGECSLAGGQGNWNIEALGHDTFDFGDDMNHAHVQPTGEYHYHGMPELLMEFLGDDRGMILVGWASDGFPVYARYAYTNPNDSNSAIEPMQPSFRLKNEPDSNRPMVLTKLSGGPEGSTNPIQRYQWEHSPKIMSMLKGLEIWTNVMEGSESLLSFQKGYIIM